MQVENQIKGKIAETIVGLLLKEAGFVVHKTGVEHLFESIIQRKEEFVSGEFILKNLSSFPDFLIEGYSPRVEPKKELPEHSSPCPIYTDNSAALYRTPREKID